MTGAASRAEQAQAAALLRDAYAVLRSDDFQRNLLTLERRYPEVYANRRTGEVPLARVAAWTANETWGSRYAPLDVELVGGADARDPRREHASAGGYIETGVYAGMSLGRAHLDQYASDDQVERSCAVNVAAHELAHTISVTPFFFTNAFTDTTTGESRIPDRALAATPVASYLIGAVAQCTWLARQGRVAPDEVGACVEVFGTRSMNWLRCGAFAAGGPVAPRAGLPPAMPPL
ncbi:hypothetical protein [Phenylobacterium sp.]|uniref:hypothetical protein n=1 Tax=Phenylobacterium sp. TaxID=1871053 RepID=UPI0035B26BBD